MCAGGKKYNLLVTRKLSAIFRQDLVAEHIFHTESLVIKITFFLVSQNQNSTGVNNQKNTISNLNPINSRARTSKCNIAHAQIS